MAFVVASDIDVFVSLMESNAFCAGNRSSGARDKQTPRVRIPMILYNIHRLAEGLSLGLVCFVGRASVEDIAAVVHGHVHGGEATLGGTEPESQC